MNRPQYLDILIPCSEELKEMLSAELFDIGFEGIWENDTALNGYILVSEFNRELLNEVVEKYGIRASELEINKLEDINWNENWEKSYEAIDIKGRCMLRAEFHPKLPDFEFDIVIQPKMSFGTGHHDSTRLIIELMLDLDLKNHSTLDVGCGTGVLAILAGMKGAQPIVALDNSFWSYENTRENALRNGVKMEVLESDIESYTGKGYQLILSNITRNINHQNIPKYAGIIEPGGSLILSGFFNHDFDFVNEQAIKHGFRLLNKAVSEKNWIALHYDYPNL